MSFTEEDFEKDAIKFEKKYGKDAKYIWNGKIVRKKPNDDLDDILDEDY